MWSGSTRSAPWSHQDAVSWRLRPCMPQRAPVLGFLNDNPQSWVSKVDRKINCNHKNTNNSKLYIENRHNTAEWFWSPLMMFGVADGPKMLFWTWNRWILALERDRKTSYTWLKMSLGRDNVIPDQIKTANCGSLSRSRILDNDFEETKLTCKYLSIVIVKLYLPVHLTCRSSIRFSHLTAEHLRHYILFEHFGSADIVVISPFKIDPEMIGNMIKTGSSHSSKIRGFRRL